MEREKERLATMSLTEIIPAVRALPRNEKFQLVRLLLDDLAEEETLSTLGQGQVFPIYTPEFSPGAAAQLASLLNEQERPSYAYCIISQTTEDRFDEVDDLEDAIRIARAVARKSQAGDPVSIEYRGRVIRQLVFMPDGKVAEKEIR